MLGALLFVRLGGGFGRKSLLGRHDCGCVWGVCVLKFLSWEKQEILRVGRNPR